MVRRGFSCRTVAMSGRHRAKFVPGFRRLAAWRVAYRVLAGAMCPPAGGGQGRARDVERREEEVCARPLRQGAQATDRAQPGRKRASAAQPSEGRCHARARDSKGKCARP